MRRQNVTMDFSGYTEDWMLSISSDPRLSAQIRGKVVWVYALACS